MTHTDLTRRALLTAGCAGCAAIAVGCAAGRAAEQSRSLTVPLAELTVGATRVFPDQKLALTRVDETTVVAFSALCTHQGCAVTLVDTVLKCPCHGSRFDPTSGAAVRGPARTPLEPRTATIGADGIVTID